MKAKYAAAVAVLVLLGGVSAEGAESGIRMTRYEGKEPEKYQLGEVKTGKGSYMVVKIMEIGFSGFNEPYVCFTDGTTTYHVDWPTDSFGIFKEGDFDILGKALSGSKLVKIYLNSEGLIIGHVMLNLDDRGQ